MVSTGKEGVIYNGLSDWLYEGEWRPGAGGGAAWSPWSPRPLLVLGDGWWCLFLSLRRKLHSGFPRSCHRRKVLLEPQGALGGQAG